VNCHFLLIYSTVGTVCKRDQFLFSEPCVFYLLFPQFCSPLFCLFLCFQSILLPVSQLSLPLLSFPLFSDPLPSFLCRLVPLISSLGSSSSLPHPPPSQLFHSLSFYFYFVSLVFFHMLQFFFQPFHSCPYPFLPFIEGFLSLSYLCPCIQSFLLPFPCCQSLFLHYTCIQNLVLPYTVFRSSYCLASCIQSLFLAFPCI
jgi:hypothetical protein